MTSTPVTIQRAIDSQRRRSQHAIDKLHNGLESDPIAALEWADDAFQAAAMIWEADLVEAYAKHGLDRVEDLMTRTMEQYLVPAGLRGGSTSESANMVGRARASIACGWFVTDFAGSQLRSELRAAMQDAGA